MEINVIIDDETFAEIMSEFGFPVLDFSDMPFGDTDETSKSYIKEKFLWPALRNFYRHWPIPEYAEYAIDSNFSVDFPSIDVFDVVDAKLNTNEISSGTPIGEPFVDASSVFSTNWRFSQKYGSAYSYGMEQAYHPRRAEYNAMKLAQAAFRFKTNKQGRQITGYSNVAGRITVTWAKYSMDWDDVPFKFYDDMIDLAKSYIFRGWGAMLSLNSTSLDNELDPSYMLERADDLKEAVQERWNNITKPIVIRNR